MHDLVVRCGTEFRAFGIITPAAIGLRPWIFEAEHGLVVVIADVTRCTSTLLAALAAGAVGVTVTCKSGEAGTSLDQAQRVGNHFGVPMVLAGELHGRPIPGGVFGNSPSAVRRGMVGNRLVHFSSTNFGATLTRVINMITSDELATGRTQVYIVSLPNVAAVANAIHGCFYRLVFCASGFYETPSLEDCVCGGDLLTFLGLPIDELDDTARLMIATSKALPTPEARCTAFSSNWIGRCLTAFGRSDDIASIVYGRGFEPEIWHHMKTLVPTIRQVCGVPVISRKEDADHA